MKRSVVFVGALVFLLGGCAKSNVVSYDLKYGDAANIPTLSQAAVRAVKGRLEAMKENAAAKSTTLNSSGTILSVFIADAAAATLTKQLTAPLNFSVMKQVPADQEEITVEKLGGLAGTGITEKHIELAMLNPPDSQGKSSVTIAFTSEGAALWKKVCGENIGKTLAVTVRHHLVSSLTVSPADLQSNSIQVSGAPDAEMAQAFTDDVNVGSRVTFSLRSSPPQR